MIIFPLFINRGWKRVIEKTENLRRTGRSDVFTFSNSVTSCMIYL